MPGTFLSRRALQRRLRALPLALALATGCATAPEMPEIGAVGAQPVKLSGARGPLSRDQSAAVLQKLKQRSGSIDILERHVAIEEAVVGSPLVTGNRVTLLEDGPATYKAMFEAIRGARDHVNLETYIFEDDDVGHRFAELLLKKQAQGVQVNVIYDSVGTIRTDRSFFERMKAAGVRVLEFNPVNPLEARGGWMVNHRDHRKLIVVDGRIAMIGGINISSVYSSSSSPRGSSAEHKDSAPWRDTHARIEGPVVKEFQRLFLQTWEKQKGDPLPRRQYFPALAKRGEELVRAIGSSADEDYSQIYVTLLSAIMNAERTIYITMAYFIPDPQLLQAIREAAERGVDVKLVLPGFSDFWAVFHAGRTRYSDLLKSGVRIYERRAALLHSKTIVIDGVWSTVGSTNMDPRSFMHNDEINAVVLGRGFATQMAAMFSKDREQSAEVTLEQWRRRPVTTRLKEWTARLWEYWM